MIYLASPYSHPNPTMQQERFKDVQAVVVNGFNRGIMYLSPIMYWHLTATQFDMPTNYHPYLQFNMELLRVCSEIHILMLDGWATSKGVIQERAAAKEVHIPLQFLAPSGQIILELE